MDKQLHPLVKLAKQAVESYVNDRKVIKPTQLTDEMKGRAGTFVSIKKHGQLRGCIGTFQPTRETIAEEIIANAIHSASKDIRFSPIEPSELNDLEYSVDVLTEPESVNDINELDPREYGLIVDSGRSRGLLLPDLEGVNTVEEQINICRAKAGILAGEPIQLYRFQVRRYR
jgi:AmmeMemoRadiSam system protein A